MRTFSKTLSRLVALVVVVALAVFAIANQLPLRVQFLGQPFAANLWWVVAGSALLGALFSLVLLAPGRVAAGWRNRSLTHEQTHREHATRAGWDQERAALLADNQRLQAGSDEGQSAPLSTTGAVPR
ncbi:MAG TPA: LapA family protein [Ktedonobacterales bacterium]|nr:LapA family protein [Ktedonobacterales bacterium]